METINKTDKSFVTIDGHHIAYTDTGTSNKPVILLIHGWISHAGIWDTTIDFLKDKYRCIAIDLLGHGHSDKPQDADYSIQAQTRRIISIADHLRIENFGIIGHSMGGLIAFNIALNSPERVQFITDIAGVVNGRLSAVMRRLYTPIIWLGARYQLVWNISRWLHRTSLYQAIMIDNVLVYGRGAATINHTDMQMALIPGIEIPAHRELQTITTNDIHQKLAAIRVPVLVLFGKEDNVVPLTNAALAAEYLPRYQLVLLDKCGHSPMRERFDVYKAALCNFLRDPDAATQKSLKPDQQMTGPLQNKVAIITGASSGIGWHTARALAAAGAHIVLTGRRAEALEDLVTSLQQYGVETLVVPGDITCQTTIEELVSKTISRFGCIDILINNAGISGGGAVDQQDSQTVDKLLSTNLVAPIQLVRAVLPTMKEQRSGLIVNVSSVAAEVLAPGQIVYAASKSGLNAFTTGLRRELAGTGIHMLTVLPGWTKTPMIARFEEKTLRTSGVLLPVHPIMEPEAVAQKIVRAIIQGRTTLHLGGTYFRLGGWLQRVVPSVMDIYYRRFVKRDQLVTDMEKLG